MLTNNNDTWNSYNHAFKYNPNGRAKDLRETYFYALQSNYMINQSMFFDVKYSKMKYFYGYYVYENPTDNRYVSDVYFQNVPGFFTGGQEKSHSKRTTVDQNFKFDFNWQINNEHNLKTGFDLIYHSIKNDYYTIRSNPDSLNYSPYIFTDTLTTYNDVFDANVVKIFPNQYDKKNFIKGKFYVPSNLNKEFTNYEFLVSFDEKNNDSDEKAEYILILATKSNINFRDTYLLGELKSIINEIDLNDRRERTHAYKIYNTKK